ncbi:MAG TPA: rhodanese-like domain-containing protein, partial [Bdellovibrionales bacterium]|nr:rhodanese-like domain-containing protein [Bdellovibrionales bacterium]
DWNAIISDPEVLVLDTRNDYEYEIGKFKGAINPNIDEFREFPERLKELAIPKDKTVLIYCTGGIRCEKAILEMNKQGYEKVYQLEGGILNYLEYMRDLTLARAQHPAGGESKSNAVESAASTPEAASTAPAPVDSLWEGECFVFDRRVAVGPDLNPTNRYALCPHCGQAASTKLNCLRCDNTFRICVKCADIPERQTCSKNCHHHHQVRPGKKGPQQRKVHL